MTEVCEAVITAPDEEWLAGFTRDGGDGSASRCRQCD
jgi:hypothetical protein